MHTSRFAPAPLSGPSLQLGLLLPVLILFVGVFVDTPIICGGRPVAVPFAPHAPQVVSSDRDIDIYVYSDGSIFIETKWYPAREFAAKLLAFRERFIGSVKTGLGVYLPTLLGPRAWFSQVIAEWIPVTPAVAAAVEKLPAKAELPEMVQALDAHGPFGKAKLDCQDHFCGHLFAR